MKHKAIHDDAAGKVVVVDDFKGYSLKDLKYQRAITALRKQYAKEQVQQHLNNLKPENLISKVSGPSSGIAQISTQVLSGMSFMDYVNFGMTAFRTGKKIVGFFKKKKK